MQPDEVKAIDMLISKRSDVGVNGNNGYVFAAPTRLSMESLRGYRCISSILKNIPDLEKPNLIRSTKLRKYIATVAQVAALKDGELEWLSAHMGHSVGVHKDFYRLHDSAIELAKVSRLLIAVDSGEGKGIAGKSLNEIELHGRS